MDLTGLQRRPRVSPWAPGFFSRASFLAPFPVLCRLFLSFDIRLADPKPHPIFDVPDQAFGVSAEEGGGDVPKLHKRMTDGIRELQKDAVLSRARPWTWTMRDAHRTARLA